VGGLRRLLRALAPHASSPGAPRPLIVKARFIESVRG
jgi:hypothetical protein